MLPKPSSAFTLPSLYDDLELKCRLYFPPLRSTVEELTCVSGAAIFAHPYAPLGGCFDDPVVHSIGSSLLKQGFILATFNFRGAEGSRGRTSWSGKGELGDYTSLYAFMLAFMSTRGMSQYFKQDTRTLLILGGYSYGSMIASHLPNDEIIRHVLQQAQEGSSEREIELRSLELAQAFLGYCETQQEQGKNSSAVLGTATPTEVVFGGYESSAAARRISDQSLKGRVDKERIQHSVERARRKLNGQTEGSKEPSIHSDHFSQEFQQPIMTPKLAFLLVSPLLGTVFNFATMFSRLRFERARKGSQTQPTASGGSPEGIFAKHPALVVFGSEDHFTSSKKLKDWCKTIADAPSSRLQFHEVAGVGHFWHEARNDAKLVSFVSTWLKSLTFERSEAVVKDN